MGCIITVHKYPDVVERSTRPVGNVFQYRSAVEQTKHSIADISSKTHATGPVPEVYFDQFDCPAVHKSDDISIFQCQLLSHPITNNDGT